MLKGQPETEMFLDFTDENFPTIQGFPHFTQMNTMPVVAYRGEEMRFLGTCFAISNQGLVLTARHVVDEAINPTPGQVSDPDGWWIGALYAADHRWQSQPSVPDQENDVLGGLIPAHKVFKGDDIDIAAIHLRLPENALTGDQLRMPAVTLSPGIPDVGDYCFALGYHAMNCERIYAGRHTHRLFQSYSASRGIIEHIHYPIRDRSVLRFPCFQTSARFDKGMSGGPILGKNGTIIGVVCSSYGSLSGDDDYLSYGSLIGPAVCLIVDADFSEGQRRCFLHEFVEGGSVLVDDTISTLAISRTTSDISVGFGSGPIMVNRIT